MSAADPFAPLLGLPGVFEAMEAARSAVDGALRHDRIRRRHDPAVTAEALRRGAAASAALAVDEGDLVDEAAVLTLLAETPTLADVVRTAPLQALARMHVIVAGGGGAEELGRPRAGADTARLAALADNLVRPTQAPAAVVAAVAHAEVVAVAPFASHNGVVARQLFRTVITARALDPQAVTVPEAGHRAAEATYRATLHAYAQPDAAGDEVAAWLVHCAHALVLGAAETKAICDASDPQMAPTSDDAG